MLRCLGGVSGRISRKVSIIVVRQNSGRGRRHRFCEKKKRKQEVFFFFPSMWQRHLTEVDCGTGSCVNKKYCFPSTTSQLLQPIEKPYLCNATHYLHFQHRLFMWKSFFCSLVVSFHVLISYRLDTGLILLKPLYIIDRVPVPVIQTSTCTSLPPLRWRQHLPLEHQNELIILHGVLTL